MQDRESCEQMDLSRNLGLLTIEQQQLLAQASVAVCGVGGMGGVAAEALVRMGVGTICLADADRYEATDMNRQLHCTHRTLGQLKVDVIGRKMLEINPALQLSTVSGVTEVTVTSIIRGCDIVVNGMDCVRSSILLEREARQRRKLIVDAWLTPYASVFVMTPEAPHWEEFLGFPTLGKTIDQITSADIQACLRREIEFTLGQFTPYSIVSPELVEEVITGQRPRPSLLPVVWLSGTLMANEVLKAITNQGKLASHWGVFYNQYEHELRNFDGRGRSRT